ncbi:MAG: Pyridoxamine 5'-phosphate oxidase, partial [uncultured Solirubrobacteraceae bacterium]
GLRSGRHRRARGADAPLLRAGRPGGGGPGADVARAARALAGRRRGGRPGRAQRDGAGHRGPRGPPERPDGPAQGPGSARAGALHEPRVAQGARGARHGARRRRLPVDRAPAPGRRARDAGGGRPRRGRRLLRLPPARLPPRGDRLPAGPGHPVAGGARRGPRRPRGPVPARERGAPAGRVGRPAPGARDRGVLAGAPGPPARPAALPPARRRGLGRRAPRAV